MIYSLAMIVLYLLVGFRTLLGVIYSEKYGPLWPDEWDLGFFIVLIWPAALVLLAIAEIKDMKREQTL